MNYREILLAKYEPYPGEPARVLDGICRALMEQTDEVPWTNFTGDDWQLLTLMARTEGVAPLMYDAFKRAGPDNMGVPAESFRELKEEYYQTAAYNALLFEELEKILGALEEAEIPVVLLKGAALAQTVYPDPALRPMSDLDLLVRYERLEQAIQIVNGAGYESRSVSYWPSLKHILGHHENLQNQAGITLELHWKLGRRSEPEEEQYAPCWQERQPFSGYLTEDGSASDISDPCVLTYTDHFLYLSAHLFLQHGAARGLLLWLYDLSRLLQDYEREIDWERLVSRSRLFGWSAPAGTVLSQLRDIFHMRIPDNLLAELKACQTSREREWISYKSLPDQSRAWAQWQTWKSLTWKEKFAYSLGSVFPSPVYLQKRYQPDPPWTWPLYYFYRWGDMVAEAVRYLSA